MTKKGKRVLGSVCGVIFGSFLLFGLIALGVKVGNKDWKKITDKDSTTPGTQENTPSAAAAADVGYLVY